MTYFFKHVAPIAAYNNAISCLGVEGNRFNLQNPGEFFHLQGAMKDTDYCSF